MRIAASIISFSEDEGLLVRLKDSSNSKVLRIPKTAYVYSFSPRPGMPIWLEATYHGLGHWIVERVAERELIPAEEHLAENKEFEKLLESF